MAWHHLYHIPWDTLDADRIADTAALLGVELGAQVQVDAAEDGYLEVWFTIPMSRLRDLEVGEFADEVRRQDLDDAQALTIEAVFQERERKAPGQPGCQVAVIAENGANELCERTAALVARRLAEELDGKVPTREPSLSPAQRRA